MGYAPQYEVQLRGLRGTLKRLQRSAGDIEQMSQKRGARDKSGKQKGEKCVGKRGRQRERGMGGREVEAEREIQ